MVSFKESKSIGLRESRKPAQENGDLLDRFHLGDSSASSELVERYHRPVYHVAYRMTQNRADAEDITQEVFVRALHSLHSLNKSSSLKTWLFKIAINLSIDHRRRLHPPVMLPPTSAEDPGPLALLERKEVQAHLQGAIARLPDTQRATLVLRIFHQLSFLEIADVVESPIGTVKANYHHAVVQLRRLLQARSPSRSS